MDMIVDIQCLKNSKNLVVPKEIAILSLNGNYSAHWMVGPSTGIDNFSSEIRKQNNWLKKHHHSLDYSEGEVSTRALFKSLKELMKKVGRVFVRRKEKWSIVHKITARELINLEYDIDCASFANLPWSDAYCF